MDYRNQEIDKITYSNTILNVIYLLIFILLVIAFLVEETYHKKLSILFLLAILPTFILPFLYGTTIKIIRYINNKYKPEVHGPKNAFLDENYEEL